MRQFFPSFRLATAFARVALACGFLSAVADRFGIWGPPGSPNVVWGTFQSYLDYTGVLLSFLPPSLVGLAGWAATVLEVVLALGLLSGRHRRWFAWASGVLLLVFALAMTISQGAESAFSYSVWAAGAAAFLLASVEEKSSRTKDLGD